MTIFDILSAPWAIVPSKLLEIHAIYDAHARGDAIDIEAVEKRVGRPLANEQRDYQVVDGVAVIEINGVIAKKMNMFSQISGGASSQLAMRAINGAQQDSAVHSIVLAYDSPGGTVDGTELFSNAILKARDNKPIVTLGTGTIASAAYWSGSAAQKVYIVDGTTAVGSIGVVTAHRDISGAEAARGVKTTELSAGKYKRIASQYGPLSEEGRASIQDQLDYMYSLFVGAVAKHRAVAAETVLSDMADGRIFTGQQALDAGLVDGILTLDELIVQLNQQASQRARTPAPSRPAASANSTNDKGTTMEITAESIKTSHPAIAAALIAEGATAERDRIKSVEDQAVAGHEKLIATMKFDGKSTGGDAAMAVLAAERKQRDAHVTATAAEAPKPAPTVPANAAAAAVNDKEAAGDGQPLTRADLDGKAKEYMAAHPGTSYVDAFKAVGGR